MRVALLASTFMLLAGSPAFAQCVYVACGGTQVTPPVTVPQQTNAYEQGYAAGVAARPATRTITRTVVRTIVRQRGPAPKARTAHRAPTRVHKAPAVRHAAATRPASRPYVVRRTATVVAPRRSNHVVTTHTRSYNDPIKNRAQTYQATSYGSATSMASLMSQSSSYSSSYTSSSSTSGVSWVGPSAVTSQNGQTCGWGARIVTNSHGQAQRQAVWVCQCPQGWRPPGY